MRLALLLFLAMSVVGCEDQSVVVMRHEDGQQSYSIYIRDSSGECYRAVSGRYGYFEHMKQKACERGKQ